MDISKIEFKANGQKYSLVMKKDKWNLINEESQVIEARFELSEEGYRKDAVRMFEIIHGYVPSFGELSPYLLILGFLAKDIRYTR